MYRFELLPEYIPHGKVSDYKERYGANFGELTVARLFWQNIEAITYVCSDTDKVYSEVKNITISGKDDIRYGTPCPVTIETTLIEVIGRTLPRDTFPIKMLKRYYSVFDITTEQVDTFVEDIYANLLDEIGDAFPFTIRHEFDEQRNSLALYIIFHEKGVMQILFESVVNNRLDDVFNPYVNHNYFSW